jgi:hypothetical protein
MKYVRLWPTQFFLTSSGFQDNQIEANEHARIRMPSVPFSQLFDVKQILQITDVCLLGYLLIVSHF